MRKTIPTAIALGMLISTTGVASGVDLPKGADNFYKSDRVVMQKVSFKNQ